jgi:hypothetical protein
VSSDHQFSGGMLFSVLPRVLNRNANIGYGHIHLTYIYTLCTYPMYALYTDFYVYITSAYPSPYLANQTYSIVISILSYICFRTIIKVLHLVSKYHISVRLVCAETKIPEKRLLSNATSPF